jgi:hydrolase, NUDIX family
MTEKNNDTREARSTRRRNRRRSRQRTPQSQPPTTTLVDATTSGKQAKTSGKTSGKKRRKATTTNRSRTTKPRTVETSMETRNETSAGGLVISGLSEAVATDGSVDLSRVYVALIGRLDRRGRLLWSMPKGHVETGEDITATAAREVWEETGIHGEVFAELGVIDYWFVSEGTRIHKTVHHHLLRYVDGELNDEDPEVTEVAWIPASGLIERFAYADERKLARIAHDLLPDLARDEQATGRSTPR